MTLNRIALPVLAVAGMLVGGTALADGRAPHWAYEGPGGPAEWGRLSHDFAACEAGREQSPIDIRNAIPARLPAVAIDYRAQPLEVVNNGHTVQVNLKPGSSIDLEGQRYELLQYHFHTPSEHAVDGRKAPLELHLVHKGAAGDIAVLGVMMVPGAASPVVEAVWNAVPAAAGPAREVAGVSLDPAELLPAGRDYFRYEGSLTTPPCSEIVHWVTFKQPVTVSQGQIDAFVRLFPNNARPLQQVNRRLILESAAE